MFSAYIQEVQDALGRGDWPACCFALQQLQQDLTGGSVYSPEAQALILDLGLQVLAQGDFETRWVVAKLLPALGSRAIGPLLEILEDEDADLDERWFAGRLLGNFRQPEVLQALVQTLQHTTDPDLGSILAEALALQGTEAISPLLAMVTHAATATPQLLWGIHALAQLSQGESVTPLLAVASHPEPQVRSAALRALGNYPNGGIALNQTTVEQITLVFQQALADHHGEVRQAAVMGLGRYGSPAQAAVFLPVLAPCLRDVNLEVGEQAALAIGRLNTATAVDSLAQELQNPLTPLPLKRCIIRALGWMTLPAAIEALQHTLQAQVQPLLAGEPEAAEAIALEIIQVLGRLTQESLKPLAVRVLLQFWADLKGDPSDRSSPGSSLKVMQALIYAWGLLKDPQAVPVLQTLREHPNAQIRLHVRKALEHCSGESRPLQDSDLH